MSSDLFDDTSVLRFLETRFGAEVPNLSAWRRAAVGDLTSALNFKKPDQSIPNLPSTLQALQQEIQECVANLAGTTPYTVPTTQTVPIQEPGTRTRPSGVCWSGANQRENTHFLVADTFLCSFALKTWPPR